uniref:Coiled-coil alpha-helical rod protein 1 n=1 Tax=Geotrypetes seraphini TaxID=260995 RepID=A0A6P8P9H1_GEOSA|nr:coiled-coil alpha-helical rod protein 1 [Geotrypetes seraphini]XP_033772182.1 coiled-coil alpha-helical rod protein 1 [Geotrypetes seraphini]XP_033772183.1 coiled-coil alpha-helical rod protein 1 [Geotrypetes seraphini]XP_033772184.1 coiled-coil alpha-helical rod protein 1 [Geotrypetes seraphini]
MDDRKKERENLEPPAAFTVPKPAGHIELIPPSHFQRKPPPALSVRAPPAGHTGRATHPVSLSPPAVALNPWTPVCQELLALRRENENLKAAQRRTEERDVLQGRGQTDFEEMAIRARSQDRDADFTAPQHKLELVRKAETISQQSNNNIWWLEAEAQKLRTVTTHLELERQEREATLASLQEEAEGLQAKLRASELERVLLEEKALRQKEELKTLTKERDRARAELERRKEDMAILRERKQEAHRLREELSEMTGKESKREQEMHRLKEELQMTQRRHQEELLKATEVHSEEAVSLQHKVQRLEEEREKVRQEVKQLRTELLSANQEREVLTEQLRGANTELDSQKSLVQQLRTYVGQLVPDDTRVEEWRQEKEQLIATVQQLEREREVLKTSMELLNIRLSSLTDILSIQEEELAKKAKPESMDMDSERTCALLTRWRQKVFALMVQLKSQEIQHCDDERQIRMKVLELEEELETRNQRQAVLLHSLQDRTAELDMERVSHKVSKDELSHAQDVVMRLQQQTDKAEEMGHQLNSVVKSFHQIVVGQESVMKAAASRLQALGQRITFASKRIDTIQGLVARKSALARLQLEERTKDVAAAEGDSCGPSYEDLHAEVELLHQERDSLSAELKRSAQIIEKKIGEARKKFEVELDERQASMRHLQEVLEEEARLQRLLAQEQCAVLKEKEEIEEDLKEQLRTSEQDLRESREHAEALREDLSQQQEQYEQALQQKVTEVEAQMQEQLTEMEKRLQEARREHTKAVVALRQVERQTTREKERTQELLKVQEAAQQQEIQRLSKKLQDLERDRNLLMATLRQEGLLKQYKETRKAVLQPSSAWYELQAGDMPSTQLQTLRPGDEIPAKESLSALLDNLQTLGAAILCEEDDPSEEEETFNKEEE